MVTTMSQSDLLARRDLVEQYLKESSSSLSAFSFINLFIWKDFFEFEFEVIGGNLCIFASDQAGIFLYLPPLGKNFKPAVIAECFQFMTRRNNGNGVSRIENVLAAQLDLFPSDKFKC